MTEHGDPTPAVLERTLDHAVRFVRELETAPVAATATLAELRARLGHELLAAGTDPVRVIDDLVADSAGGHNGSASGRFFGWVIGGSLPAALGADWLTSTWDQNAGIYACGPAVAVIEEVAGAWLKEVLGLPTAASFAFVTGCQMAHVTALAAARHALLERRGWDVERDGLAGAPAIRILTSTEKHGTIDRAVRLLGLGQRSMAALPVGDDGRLAPRALADALAQEPGRPTIVVLQAGDLHLGAFDDFAALIPIAHAAGAWVHVDGAFGLWAAASPAHRHLLRDVETADSWATDGHKWLNVPYDSGYAFVADPAPHRVSMSYWASYITESEHARDALDWNPEFSRRGRGVATYAALRELGRDGVRDLVDRCCRHAVAIVSGIGALPGAEVVWTPTLNQGLLRFRDPRPGASEQDHDRRTDEVAAKVLATGEALLSNSTWRGRRCMRVSVVNWRTNEEDVRRTVAAVASVLGG